MGNREWGEKLSSFVVYAVHGVSCKSRINPLNPPIRGEEQGMSLKNKKRKRANFYICPRPDNIQEKLLRRLVIYRSKI
jgi:hypothetical protein